MGTLTLLAGHPYLKQKPAVWRQNWNGKWTVRWRDFWGVKQDREFDTEQAARALASTLFKPPLTINDEDMGPEAVAMAERFWSDL